MATVARPRRSVLYMPGSNARALEKARTLAADGLILDLEDAVSPDAKDVARQQVCDAVKAGGYGGRELLVRVNGLATPWGAADVAAAATCGAHGILIPKVESADMVRQVEALMVANGAPADMAIWCMMETPRGMLKAEEIAGSTPRMGGFVMGTSDLAKDLHCAHTAMRLPMITSLGLCLLAARAWGLAALDGVYLDLNDDAGFEAHCQQGLELGFDGKTLIHPKTIETANRVFAPSEKEITWSKTIIAAHAEAAKEGKGVVVVEGKLIENLHVENARRIVALSDQIAALAAASA
ncbi:HpcH/HpaI aldolase/citrate lyase family protein [Magnetospirillum moscoviense]|uniref:Malyl-CoA thiolesterase n=1 Tax=Magnetospirillum moscoviense TaxID=1437059 RepID=A0A178N1L9_9PROT|nr:CoA ester lyase [Magnetospirillum moscoviense]OAN65528.1 malyl-CoA thiolesterase [Magnetospirillum moscoviense]